MSDASHDGDSVDQIFLENAGEFNVSGAGPVLSDFTKLNLTEIEKAEIEERNLQLQRADSLERMTGAVANIFNNQLHVVTGYLGMVIAELPPDDQRAVKLTKALNAARKASEVSGFLTTSIGQIPGKPALIDLAELCLLNLPVLQAGKPKDVSLETDLPSPGPVISANAKQVQQILANLIINAWEAIADGTGSIRLKVKTVSQSDIPSSHRFPADWRPKGQDYACLEVTDSGCGIKEKDMGRIFEPFFSTKPTGAGLGLPIVLGIVGNHDSVVTVETKLDVGSVFRVFFPLSGQTVSSRKEQPAKAPAIGQGYTVLLAEDEEGVRKITELALVKLGFKVLQARDGVEAVKTYEQHGDEISCLVCDLSMPNMGGWETISALRSIRKDLPVVLATGYDEDSGVMVSKHDELPDFYLTKPYDLHGLGDTILKSIALKKGKEPKS